MFLGTTRLVVRSADLGLHKSRPLVVVAIGCSGLHIKGTILIPFQYCLEGYCSPIPLCICWALSHPIGLTFSQSNTRAATCMELVHDLGVQVPIKNTPKSCPRLVIYFAWTPAQARSSSGAGNTWLDVMRSVESLLKTPCL